MWRFLLESFFPTRCGLCDARLAPDVPALCADCAASFPQWEGRACRVCGVPLPDGGARCWECRKGRRAFRFCRNAGLYEGGLRRAILLLKYAGREALAEPLGRRMAVAAARPELRGVDVLVPVPLHFVRRHARGYNQAKLLAGAVSKEMGTPVVEALRRRRWTRAQAGLRRNARRRNVEGVFEPTPAAVGLRGRHALLIDDVCTTGATLEACARALRAAGARRVDALTLSRNAFKGRKKNGA